MGILQTGIVAALFGFLIGALGSSWLTHKFDTIAVAKAENDLSACHATISDMTAQANKATVDALSNSIHIALNENTKTQAALTARAQQTANLFERLNHVPATHVCASAPAIRTWLDGMRYAYAHRDKGANSSGLSANAGHRLPAGTGPTSGNGG